MDETKRSSKFTIVNLACDCCGISGHSTRDHLVPSAWQKFIPYNVHPLCFRCNHVKSEYERVLSFVLFEKGTMSLEQVIKLLKETYKKYCVLRHHGRGMSCHCSNCRSGKK